MLRHLNTFVQTSPKSASKNPALLRRSSPKKCGRKFKYSVEILGLNGAQLYVYIYIIVRLPKKLYKNILDLSTLKNPSPSDLKFKLRLGMQVVNREKKRHNCRCVIWGNLRLLVRTTCTLAGDLSLRHVTFDRFGTLPMIQVGDVFFGYSKMI